MEPTVWQREAQAAASIIDGEHGLQLNLVDQVLKALEQEAHAVADRLSDLRAASDLHFANEEQQMRQHSYPRYGMHVEEHRKLVEWLGDLEARHAKGEALEEKVVAMRRWLAAHISGMDKDFEDFVRGAA